MTDKLGRNASNLRRSVVKAEIARVRSRDFGAKLKTFGPRAAETHKAGAKSFNAQKRVDADNRTLKKGGPGGKPVAEHKGGGKGQRRDARGRFA